MFINIQLPREWARDRNARLAGFTDRYMEHLDRLGLSCPKCSRIVSGNRVGLLGTVGDILFCCYSCLQPRCFHCDFASFTCTVCSKFNCSSCSGKETCDVCLDILCMKCKNVKRCNNCEKKCCEDCIYYYDGSVCEDCYDEIYESDESSHFD